MTITRNRIITAVVLAGLAVVYFAAVPFIQLKNYKTSESKHNLVNDQLVLVYDSFKNGNDNRQTVQDAQSTLDANKAAITKFSALPLLAWNKQYRYGSDTDKSEEAYVATAQNFLDDYTALLDFKTQSNRTGLLDQAKNAATRLKLDSKIQLEMVELRLLDSKITKGYAQL